MSFHWIPLISTFHWKKDKISSQNKYSPLKKKVEKELKRKKP